MAELAAPFLEAAAAGRLLIQRCAPCGHAQLPPRVVCGTCGAPAPAWVEAGGGAQLVSFAVLHRAPTDAHRALVPYVYALVELDEGPRIITHVVDAPEPRIGQALQVRWRTLDGDAQAWPVFAPAP